MRNTLPAILSVICIASFAAVCASSANPVRLVAGLILIAATCAAGFLHRRRFDGIVPALGLTLTFLILAALALAAARILSAVPVALTLTVAALAAAWTSAPAERAARPKPNPLVVAGVLIFAAAAVAAVRYSAAGATSDADAASSVAIWAYPSGGQFHIGVKQPAGHGAATLRIVVTQAGVTVATWNDIRLAAGQSWEAALTLKNGAADVVALQGGTVVARLSSGP
jgi:hypothetical protein